MYNKPNDIKRYLIGKCGLTKVSKTTVKSQSTTEILVNSCRSAEVKHISQSMAYTLLNKNAEKSERILHPEFLKPRRVFRIHMRRHMICTSMFLSSSCCCSSCSCSPLVETLSTRAFNPIRPFNPAQGV